MNSAGDTPPQSKQHIRSEVLRKRKELEAGAVATKSRAIEVMLAGSGLLRDVSVVLSYVSAKDNEVDTHSIIGGLLAGGKTVFVPVSDMGKRLMQWSRLLGLNELERTHFGLLEPAAQFRRIEPIAPRTVCLVPGLAFTRAGWRLGYGGGYFDRFLDTFSGVPIGLAYDVQIMGHIPAESHDQPVDYVVTESGVINCQELRNLGFTGA